MTGELRPLSANELPSPVNDYWDSLNYVLLDIERSAKFQIYHPAPPEISADQLELLANTLRYAGWNAEVAPVDEVEYPLKGIRVTSKE